MEYEHFEEELKEVLNEKFKERLINLKKTGNIFSPMFYLVFTRLVELSSIMNDVVLPNEYELKEMFRTRKEFLQLDYNTINETVKRIWFFETKRGKEYDSSKSMEDFLYVIYRMKDIQERIDRVILKNVREWKKDELAKLYFHMIKVFLEVDEEVNEAVNRMIRIDFIKILVDKLVPKERKGKINEVLEKLSEMEMRAISENYKAEIAKLDSHLKSLKREERLLLFAAMESLLDF